VICKFRISGHIAENLTFTFRAGFPNKTGGVTYFGDPIDIPVSKGAPISKPLEKAGGLGNDSVSRGPTPSGDSIPSSGGGSVSGGASSGARGIGGSNFSNPPPVPAPKKILTKEEY